MCSTVSQDRAGVARPQAPAFGHFAAWEDPAVPLNRRTSMPSVGLIAPRERSDLDQSNLTHADISQLATLTCMPSCASCSSFLSTYSILRQFSEIVSAQ